MEDIVRNKGLDGREVLLYTDNMVSEIIAEAGSSRTENLYDLVVQLHCLCMRYRCQFIFIHVAGIRMIGQETDGLYRGRLYEGAMN